MMIANVTATKDGETLEDESDVGRPSLSSLLEYADEIEVHEVHNEEQVDDLEARYATEWEEKVTVEGDETDGAVVIEELDEGDELERIEDGERRVVTGFVKNFSGEPETAKLGHETDDGQLMVASVGVNRLGKDETDEWRIA